MITWKRITHEITSVFIENRENKLIRNTLYQLTAFSILLAFLRLEMAKRHFTSVEFETLLFSLAFLIVGFIMFIITWRAGNIAKDAHQQKIEAEKALSIVNYSLGKIILDRTDELNQVLAQLETFKRQANDASHQELVDKLTEQKNQLTSFAHIASHDLRGPVSNLNSLLCYYKQAENLTEKNIAFEKFEAVTSKLTDVVDELTEVLKTQENRQWKLEKISFDEILERTKELIKSQLLETGALIKTNFTQAPEIFCKKSYMECILLNLISNAIKFRSSERRPEIFIETLERNGTIELTVRDNGLGIDMEKHGHKLFGFRKTFHRNAQAKGAGLFMAKAQVEAMGGTITATSEVNKGTTFTIVFNKSV